MATSRDFDVFISYARADNGADASGRGWVTGIKEVIEEDSRCYEGREYRVFFDTSEITEMQDWKTRILGALRTSKVLLVCLSPEYFASDPCRWEWDEYLKRQARIMARSGAGEADDGTVASVFFVELPDADSETIRVWRDQATRGHGVDLRPWFPNGAAALATADVRRRIEALGTTIWQRLERAARAETAVGNLMRFNPYFVGRTAQLDQLNRAVQAPGSIGVVTAVHGLGGLGKTELTVQFAHANRDRYAAGVWLLRAEGHREVLPLVATLADEPAFDFATSKDAADDPELRGREVLVELQRRIKEQDGRILLILDNVSEADLLAEPQTALLPRLDDLQVVATTRLGESDFARNRGSLGFLVLGELDADEGLTLIQDHQPDRGGGQPDFENPEQEQAAASIVSLLGGFTLAIEQVAIYLGRSPGTQPSAFREALLAHGLTLADQTVTAGAGVGGDMRHQGKTLAAVLTTTLADLDPPTQTVLRLAALLPPDSVPWPWLHELAVRLHPEISTGTGTLPRDGWADIRRTLTGRRLLTATAVPGLARLHRLVGAYLQGQATPAERDALNDQLVARAEAINNGHDVAAWEYPALLDALIPRVVDDPDLPGRLNLDSDLSNFSDRLGEYVGDGRPGRLAALILASVEGIATARPGNLDAQRELSISLNNVAGLQQGADPATALALFQRSLTIAEDIATARPGNLDAQRELSVSLNNVAGLQQGVDPATALALFQRSLTIAEDIATARPGNLDAQRDLSISLNNAAGLQQGADPATALALYQRSLTIREDIATARPGNLDAQRQLAVSLINTASVTERLAAAPGMALPLWQRGCEVMQALAHRGALGAELGPYLNYVCDRARDE